jgi:ElaB/YqjD/DUF883 family membrane-anchored ribosome-binding protein
MEQAKERTKEEIAAEIEQARRDTAEALHSIRYAVTDGNPGVRAWRATQSGYRSTRDKVVTRAQQTDLSIRSNIYPAIGIAFAVGAVVGLFAMRRK